MYLCQCIQIFATISILTDFLFQNIKKILNYIVKDNNTGYVLYHAVKLKVTSRILLFICNFNSKHVVSLWFYTSTERETEKQYETQCEYETYCSDSYGFLFFSFSIGDSIGDMLGPAVSEIAGRAKQAFIVGNGLSKEGVRLLGKKLACMTIGDLEALLDLKNIDPIKVAELMKNIGDLAKALVSFILLNNVF